MLSYLKKNKKLKVGILGGSFDPPHEGHLHIANLAIKRLKLDYLIFVVTKKNPFKKKPTISVKNRIKLTKQLIDKFKKKMKVEFLETNNKNKYSYYLIKNLSKINIKNSFYLIMGADCFIKFHKWYKWKKITEISKIAIFDRAEFTHKALNSIAAKKLNKNVWRFYSEKKINISSSKLRKI